MKKALWIAIPLAILFFLLPLAFSFPPLKSLFISAVEKKVQAKVDIDRIRFSWFGPQIYEHISFHAPEINGSIERFVSYTPFWALSSQHSFSFTGANFQSLSGAAEDVQGEIRGEKIHLSGKTREDNQTGEFQVQGTLSDLTATGSHMPSLLLDRLLDAKGYLITALGPEFSIQAQSSLQEGTGQLNLRIFSSSANMTLKAAFTPPKSLSLDTLHVQQGTLDLGRFPLQNNAPVHSVFSLLKNRNQSNVLTAWVTPIDFTLHKGTLQIDRFDVLLANSIHVCAWGKLDLSRRRIDMWLGVPSDALTKAFGFSFPARFALSIPIRGSFDAPQFDTDAAAAKIATILASQQIPKVGGILGLFGTSAVDESSEIPPPKYPFPWER